MEPEIPETDGIFEKIQEPSDRDLIILGRLVLDLPPLLDFSPFAPNFRNDTSALTISGGIEGVQSSVRFRVGSGCARACGELPESGVSVGSSG